MTLNYFNEFAFFVWCRCCCCCCGARGMKQSRVDCISGARRTEMCSDGSKAEEEKKRSTPCNNGMGESFFVVPLIVYFGRIAYCMRLIYVVYPVVFGCSHFFSSPPLGRTTSVRGSLALRMHSKLCTIPQKRFFFHQKLIAASMKL